MKINTIRGTYGSELTPCDIYTKESRGGTWYCVDGSKNVNFTYDELQNGVDVECLNDVDTFTAEEINSEDDFELAFD